MAKMPKRRAISAAPAMPPAKPSSTLFVACAASTEVMAAASIIPSMPRLMMPLRWTTSSPCTARSSGVAATMASGITSSAASNMLESDQHEDDRGLAEGGHGGGDVGGALQFARAGDQRAEEEGGGERGKRMELREQRHGDPGVA